MEENEINYKVLVSIKNYKIVGMREATMPQKQRILFLNSKIKDQAYLETEIFKSFFGEDLGKKEFFLEAGSYGNIVEAYKKKLRTLLEDEHKVTRSLGFTQSKSKRLVFNATVSAELYSVPTKTRK